MWSKSSCTSSPGWVLCSTTAEPPTNVWFRAVVANQIDVLDNNSFKIDNRWTLKVTSAGNTFIRQQPNQRELLIPIQFNGNEATIELTYDW